MRSRVSHALTELLAVVMAAGVATAYAGDYETGIQQQDQPKDCKEEPRRSALQGRAQEVTQPAQSR